MTIEKLSQQAASVGGDPVEVIGYVNPENIERMRRGDLSGYMLEDKQDQRRTSAVMTVAQHERIVSALSPAGGGVVMPERKSAPELMLAEWHEVKGWNLCLDEIARLNAKPQANSQWLAPEDELNVALVLSHAEDLRLQGHAERADALVQAAEEYVAILAEVQAAQRGMRFRAGEL